MGKCNFVYAEETEESTSNVNLEIICPEVILVGGEYQCAVHFKNSSGDKVVGIELNYYLPAGVSYINFETSEIWEKDSASSSAIVLTSKNEVTSDTLLGYLTFKSTSNLSLDKSYDVGVSGKVSTSDKIDSYLEIDKKTFRILVFDVNSIFDYIKIGDHILKLENGTKKYTSIVENEISSVKIDSKLKENVSNLKFKDGFENRVISDLKVGDNLNYLVIESNGFEVLRLELNINRKDESGEVVQTDENIKENPKTGQITTIIIFTILIVSIIILNFVEKKGLNGDV